MFDLVEAIRDVIKSADGKLRDLLATTLDAYAKDFPQEYFWAVGAQSPTLLNTLMFAIDTSCRDEICEDCAAIARKETVATILEKVSQNLTDGKISGATNFTKQSNLKVVKS